MSSSPAASQFFLLLSNHFGAVCVVVVMINVAIWWVLARRDWQDDPHRREEESKLLRGIAIVFGVPFLIMEAGALSPGQLTVWHFFRPQDGNPFVLGFFAWLFGFAIVFAIWVWFLGGDDFMARNLRVVRLFRFPGRLVPLALDDWHVKVGAFLLLALYTIATAAMVHADIQLETIETLTSPPASGGLD